jgi:hypothetical protein
MVYDPCLLEDLTESDFTGSSNSNNIDALHVLADGNIILSTDSTPTLGGLTFDENDVVEYDPQQETAKLKFSISQPIDAIHWVDDQNVILSTTYDWDFGGETYKKGDLVKYDPCSTTAERYFNADNFGWTSNIDGVYIRDNNNIILSTENGAELGGIVFNNNCLIEYNPNGAVMDGLEPNTARLYFQQDLSLSDGALDALFITDSNDIIFSTAEDDILAELSFRDGDLVKCKVAPGYLEDILAIAAGRRAMTRTKTCTFQCRYLGSMLMSTVNQAMVTTILMKDILITLLRSPPVNTTRWHWKRSTRVTPIATAGSTPGATSL